MGTDQYAQVGSARDTKILNPQDAAMHQNALNSLSGLQDNYANILKNLTGNQAQFLLGNISSAANGYANVGQGITNAASAFGNIDTSKLTDAANAYNPQAANNALLSQMPNYQKLAQSSAAQSLSQYSDSAKTLAAQATKDALASSANELANSGILYSGAGNQAMMQAALTPQAQLQTNLASMQSNAYNSILNQLLGSGASQLSQGYETQNNNALTAANADITRQANAAQARLSAANSQLNVADSNVNAQNAAYNAYLNNIQAQLSGVGGQSSLLSNLANATQQQYYTPQYAKKTSWLDYLSAAGGAAGGAAGLLAVL